MVTSCIAHSAPEAADSGFLWFFCQLLGERDKQKGGRCGSPDPLQVQTNRALEICQLCVVCNVYLSRFDKQAYQQHFSFHFFLQIILDIL